MRIKLLILSLLFICSGAFAQTATSSSGVNDPQDPSQSTFDPNNTATPTPFGSNDIFNPNDNIFTTDDGPADQGDPPPFDPGVDDFVPVDGGLSLLLAAGLGLGAKRAYRRYKKNGQENEPKEV